MKLKKIYSIIKRTFLSFLLYYRKVVILVDESQIKCLVKERVERAKETNNDIMQKSLNNVDPDDLGKVVAVAVEATLDTIYSTVENVVAEALIAYSKGC